jgi:hypothetical protein
MLYYLYKKVLIRFNNLMCRLRHRLRILHLHFASEHAAVFVGLLYILEEAVLINNYIFT